MGRPKKIKDLQIMSDKEVEMSNDQAVETAQTELDQIRLELEKAKQELEETKSKVKVGRDAEEQKILDKQLSFMSKNEGLKKKIEEQKEYDSQPVTGKFINRRAPGMNAKLTYLKYPDDPVKWWDFQDGKVYTIPRGFADQINDHYYTPNFIQKTGEMDPNRPSSAIHEVDTSNKKYAFVPINF